MFRDGVVVMGGECRRPLEGWEVPLLAGFGARLAELRRAAGLSQRELGAGAQLHPSSVSRLERGVRRPRASTMGRVVAVLVAAEPGLGRPRLLLLELLGLAGEAVAAESAFAERVARRRARRVRSRSNRAVAAAAHERERREREGREASRTVMRSWSGSLDTVVKALLAEERALLAERGLAEGRDPWA